MPARAEAQRTGRDVGTPRPLLGHSPTDTMQLYTDEIELDQLKGRRPTLPTFAATLKRARLDEARRCNSQVR
jgi:hypothetical protein